MSDPSSRFVDLFGSMPTPERLAFEILSWGSEPGYSGVFRDRWADLQNLPREVVAQVAALPRSSYPREAVSLLAPHARRIADLVSEFRRAGAVRTVLHNLLPTNPGLRNDDLAAITTQFPDDLLGFARIDPTTGIEAANEIRRCVSSFGFRGATMTPFWHQIRCDDETCFPIYETCSALGIPIWIHMSVNWKRTTPLSFEHPLHIDAVACKFPDLKIIAGHGGWPWIQDMVAVAWRHPNVFVDTTAFRPKHIATPGSGWDMLWYFMQRTLQEKVLFGSTWTLLGMSLDKVVAEVAETDLDTKTKERWLYGNAAKLFDLTR
ncbi:hypothetical protein FHS85_002620 [Rhodoligotrophos appendicifer]|uniref:amidohydrolase family protein n=1 Tax=Rhodoligotrophos appendicifer TaxID=987056 RepID=UPI001186B41D|nr:amidohydrolase family protein [Rhodoligotrophos appendicifer]